MQCTFNTTQRYAAAAKAQLGKTSEALTLSRFTTVDFSKKNGKKVDAHFRIGFPDGNVVLQPHFSVLLTETSAGATDSRCRKPGWKTRM